MTGAPHPLSVCAASRGVQAIWGMVLLSVRQEAGVFQPVEVRPK